jgi:hypothetical protein
MSLYYLRDTTPKVYLIIIVIMYHLAPTPYSFEVIKERERRDGDVGDGT